MVPSQKSWRRSMVKGRQGFAIVGVAIVEISGDTLGNGSWGWRSAGRSLRQRTGIWGIWEFGAARQRLKRWKWIRSLSRDPDPLPFFIITFCFLWGFNGYFNINDATSLIEKGRINVRQLEGPKGRKCANTGTKRTGYIIKVLKVWKMLSRGIILIFWLF